MYDKNNVPGRVYPAFLAVTPATTLPPIGCALPNVLVQTHLATSTTRQKLLPRGHLVPFNDPHMYGVSALVGCYSQLHFFKLETLHSLHAFFLGIIWSTSQLTNNWFTVIEPFNRLRQSEFVNVKSESLPGTHGCHSSKANGWQNLS